MKIQYNCYCILQLYLQYLIVCLCFADEELFRPKMLETQARQQELHLKKLRENGELPEQQEPDEVVQADAFGREHQTVGH